MKENPTLDEEVAIMLFGSFMVQISLRFVADLKELADLQRYLNEIGEGFREHNRKIFRGNLSD